MGTRPCGTTNRLAHPRGARAPVHWSEPQDLLRARLAQHFGLGRVRHGFVPFNTGSDLQLLFPAGENRFLELRGGIPVMGCALGLGHRNQIVTLLKSCLRFGLTSQIVLSVKLVTRRTSHNLSSALFSRI